MSRPGFGWASNKDHWRKFQPNLCDVIQGLRCMIDRLSLTSFWWSLIWSSQATADSLNRSQGKFLPVQCDIGDEDAIQAMFDVTTREYGGVDVMINNAAFSPHCSMLEGTPDQWLQMCKVSPHIIQLQQSAICINLLAISPPHPHPHPPPPPKKKIEKKISYDCSLA